MGRPKARARHVLVQSRRNIRLAMAFAVAATLILSGFISAAQTQQAFATGGGKGKNPTQNVTCEFISADYHRPLTNGDHINVDISPTGKQVNMYVDQNIAGGASYNGQNNLGLRWKILGIEQTPIPLTLEQVKSGVITFNYGAELKKQGINSWTIAFVQTNSTDTWPKIKCGEEPPVTPKDASVSVSAGTDASCTAVSTVKFDIVNATWDSEADLTVGTHTRTATAANGHQFADGTTKATVTYTINDKLPEQSTDPSKPCYVPPTPVDAVFTAPTVNDVCGTKDDSVTLGESEHGSFKIASVTPLDNGRIRHRVVFTPNEGVVVSPPGESDTYELIDGKAVWKLYTTNEPCPPVEVPNAPQYQVTPICGGYSAIFANLVDLTDGQVTPDAEFTYTDELGKTQTVSVPANEVKTISVSFPEDSGEHTVQVGIKGEDQQQFTIKTDCVVTPPEYFTPVDVTYVDKCALVNDRVVIPGNPKASYQTSATDSETGRVYRSETYPVKNGTYYVSYEEFNGKLTSRTIFVTPTNVVPRDPKETGGDYVIENGLAVWYHEFTNEACPTPGPTPSPSVNPTPKPSTVATPPKTPSKGQLAVTGSSSAPLVGATILLLGVGAGLVIVRRRKPMGNTDQS